VDEGLYEYLFSLPNLFLSLLMIIAGKHHGICS